MNEKEAIEILKNDEMYITDSFYREFRTTIADKYTKAFETVLNLIEKKNLEITSLQMEHNHDLKMIDEVKGEAVKLYKMIDLMAEQLTTPIHSKEWVINYYKKEIEKGKEE